MVVSPTGSSPRVRGADVRDGQPHVVARIIPARAGSSSTRIWPSGLVEDHPRACGEQMLSLFCILLTSGSSPRVRGAAYNIYDNPTQWRIIPARAGSSSFSSLSAILSADHPRACGEQVMQLAARVYRRGSSPRVRGAARCVGAQDLHLRIIPARAGSSVRTFYAIV